jgi:hypothetical protein
MARAGRGVDPAAKAEVDWLIALVGNLRTAKNELGIAPGAKLDAYLPEPSEATRGNHRTQSRRDRPAGAPERHPLCSGAGWRGDAGGRRGCQPDRALWKA